MHDFGLVASDDVEAMVVGARNEVVVGIDKLDILSMGQLQSVVAGSAESCVFLSDIDDFILDLL